jgi:fucose permease
MCGRLTVASISGKVNKAVLIVVLALLNTAFFVLMIASSSAPCIVLGLLGTGLSMSGIYPTTLSTMKRAYNASPLATGFAIGIPVTGGIAMPIIVGAIAERYGVAHGISCIALALGMMLLLSVIKLVRASGSRCLRQSCGA